MAPNLRRFFLLLLLLPLLRRSDSAPVNNEYIYTNFTASSVNYLEKGGIFLNSNASIFSAILYSDSPQSPYVFSIIHPPTSTIVWSANARNRAPYTSMLSFSPAGFSISSANGDVVWSTPRLPRPAAAAHLLDSGNLQIIDAANVSMWQSFDNPTDTLLSSQRLPSRSYLSTIADDYRLTVTDGDAILLWAAGGTFQQFWRVSSDIRFFKNINSDVAYMMANESGLYLFSEADSVVFQISLPPTKLRFLKLESNGQLSVSGYSGSGTTLDQALVAPSGACDLPSSCKELAVCTTQNQGATCNCPASFAASSGSGCSPADGATVFTPSGCGGRNKSQQSYRSVGTKIGYVPNKFAAPETSARNFSACSDICSGNCSCVGFFYSATSQSCFLIKNQIGSFVSTTNNGVSETGEGYIKVLASSHSPSGKSGSSSSSSNLLPILLPSIAVFLLIIVLIIAGTQWYRRRRLRHSGKRKPRTAAFSKPSATNYLGQNHLWPSPSDEHRLAGGGDSDSDSDEIFIPGLPTRFAYSDLAAATDNFSVKIGSGGFGEVFKGQLSDKTLVAVKRISLGLGGVHGKKEFCTEIAVIGNIHHVNLVRLRGFCTEGRRRMLVLEYMNRGSLDRPLFSAAGPVLEWQERMDIAIGAARGLAYLHFGCDQKIIHCDVKPENILLHDGGGVKISDFGLAKLISPEQSGFFTTMRGTRGYLAPEWLTNSPISDRTDVYSYGMVLLEIIRGRKNRSVEYSGGGGRSSSGSSGVGDVGYFPMAALEMHEKGRYVELADRRLEGRVREEEVRLAVKVALCCLHEDPGLRPTMASVVAMLEGTVEVTQPRPEALNFLRLYGRGFVDYGGGSSTTTGEVITGTNSSSSGVSYSYMTSQEVSGPR